MSATTATVDQDMLGRLLLDVEAHAHRGGWDQPANMMIIYDARYAETGDAYRHLMSPSAR